jgi:aminoglycoside phosphotransferase (APT) family kinase protein
MDRVRGLDLLTIVSKQPWRVWWAARVTGSLQAAMHEVVAPQELPSTKETYRGRMTRSALVPDAIHAFAEEVLESLPDGDRLCHGDLHPGNVIDTEGEAAIIDWTNVTRGDPMADYARTLLMMRMGSVPPGSPLVIRIGAHGLRGLMVGSYVGAYRRARPVDAELVYRWETVVAANRLADDIPEEREPLLRLLAKRMDER